MKVHLKRKLYFKKLHDTVGYISSNLSFQNKKVLNSVALHYIITQNVCEINQFIDGLKSFGVLDVLRRNQNEARAILQVSHVKLTPEVVDDLFLFELSPVGSNRVFNFTLGSCPICLTLNPPLINYRNYLQTSRKCLKKFKTSPSTR